MFINFHFSPRVLRLLSVAILILFFPLPSASAGPVQDGIASAGSFLAVNHPLPEVLPQGSLSILELGSQTLADTAETSLSEQYAQAKELLCNSVFLLAAL